MENRSPVVDRLEEISALGTAIKEKFDALVFKQASVDSLLLGLVNNVALIKNLAKDAFTFTHIKEAQLRRQVFQAMPYLKQHAPQLQTKPINVLWYQRTLDVVAEVLEEISDANQHNRPLVQFLEQKLGLFMVIYPYAITFDNEDIFSLDKTSRKWDEVSTFTTFKVLAHEEAIMDSINSFRKAMKTATALAEKAYKAESQIGKLFSYATRGVLYFLMESERNQKNIQFRSNMEIAKVRSMVNFFEDGISKYMMRIAFPFISQNNKVYIDYTYPSVSTEAVLRWMAKQMLFPFELDSPKNKIAPQDSKLFTPDTNRICVRVLCNEDFKTGSKKPKKKFSKVIVHIHGGGFIGLSSRSHQVYTRKWAKETNLPVFSVDYRKAPQCPYPGPLDDCWQVYNWVVNESHKYFNLEEKKEIILCGDSAGGNLILGITNLCIQMGVQKPFAIIAFYPALNLLIQNFTPSLMHSLEDPLLSFEFLFLCLRSYIQGQEFLPGKDYLISPILTPDALVKQYPPVRLFAGEIDPLYDDSIRFGIRLKQNDVHVKMVSYQNMVHGFLNLDIPGGIKYASECVADSVKAIQEFS